MPSIFSKDQNPATKLPETSSPCGRRTRRYYKDNRSSLITRKVDFKGMGCGFEYVVRYVVDPIKGVLVLPYAEFAGPIFGGADALIEACGESFVRTVVSNRTLDPKPFDLVHERRYVPLDAIRKVSKDRSLGIDWVWKKVDADAAIHSIKRPSVDTEPLIQPKPLEELDYSHDPFDESPCPSPIDVLRAAVLKKLAERESATCDCSSKLEMVQGELDRLKNEYHGLSSDYIRYQERAGKLAKELEQLKMDILSAATMSEEESAVAFEIIAGKLANAEQDATR